MPPGFNKLSLLQIFQHLVSVWIRICGSMFAFLSFFFFFFPAVCFDFLAVNSVPVHYLRVSQTSLFSNSFIKNGFHSIIHMFKNYFTTVFLVFSFSKISYIQTDFSYWTSKSLRIFASVSNILFL